MNTNEDFQEAADNHEFDSEDSPSSDGESTDTEDSEPEIWEGVTPESIDSEMGVEQRTDKKHISEILMFFFFWHAFVLANSPSCQ